MRVAALSLAGSRAQGLTDFMEELEKLLRGLDVRLAVLPAYAGLLLARQTGLLPQQGSFRALFSAFAAQSTRWNREYRTLCGALAAKLGLYLLAGTTLEHDQGRLYHTAYLFGPQGEICGKQRQTHLTREERELGLSRGTELLLFPAGPFQVGIVIGNDSRHPETGRILALQGADILLHPGAMGEGFTGPSQEAGMWAQVQQNQCWAVEAQRCGTIGERSFAAASAFIGPCEATADLSGYLARGSAGTAAVSALLDQAKRRQAKENFPVLRQLTPEAYGVLYRHQEPEKEGR